MITGLKVIKKFVEMVDFLTRGTLDCSRFESVVEMVEFAISRDDGINKVLFIYIHI